MNKIVSSNLIKLYTAILKNNGRITAINISYSSYNSTFDIGCLESGPGYKYYEQIVVE